MTYASGTAPEPNAAGDPPMGTGEYPGEPYQPTGTPGWSGAASDPAAGPAGEQSAPVGDPGPATGPSPAPTGPASGEWATGEQPTGASAASGPAGAAPQAASPFRGIPASDYVRDGVAALLLLFSLTLPWDLAYLASGRAEVVVVTALSLLSLTVPYLARASVFPASWTVHTTRRVRLFANLPYFLLVAVYLVLDAVGGDWGGVGMAVALGLAGAVLAAQPRQNELGPVEADAAVGGRWLQGLVIVGGLLGVTLLTSLVFTAVPDWVGVQRLLAVILAVLFVAALFAVPAVGVLRRVEAARLTLVGLGGALVALVVLGQDTFALGVGSMRAGTFGLVLIPAAAAIAASPAVRRSMRGAQPVTTWIGMGVRAFDLLAITGGYVVVAAVLRLSFVGSSVVVFVTLAVGLAGAGIAVVGRLALARDAVKGRTTAVFAALVVSVLGIVLHAVMVSEGFIGSRSAVLLLAFGLPALVLVAVSVPREVREYVAASPTYAPIAGRAYVWQPPAPKPVRVAPQPQPQPGGPQGGYPGGPQGGYPGAPQGGYPGGPGGQQQPGAYPGAAYPGAQPVGQPDRAASRVLPASAGYAGGGESTSVLPPFDPAQPGYTQYAPPGSQQPAYGEEAPAAGQYGPGQQGYGAQAQPTQAQPTQAQPTQVQPTQAAEPAGQYAGYPAPGESAAPTQQMQGFTASQAADPATPLEVLAQIVQDAPHLRPQVAANPSTYPALLDWLSALGDPAVDTALRARQ